MEAWAEPFFRALLAGYLCGVIVSIPPGPIVIAVINQALREGFRSAFKLGIGGVCGDMIYCSVMLAGHATVLEHRAVTHVLRFVAVGVLGALALRYIFFRQAALERSEAQAERVEERWHHPRSFFLGFAITSTNLMLALLWATLAAFLIAHGWVGTGPLSRAGCIIGVFFGATTWLCALAWFVARAHRQVTPRALTSLVRACGVVLLMLTFLFAWRVFVQPAQSTGSTPGGAGVNENGAGLRLSTE